MLINNVRLHLARECARSLVNHLWIENAEEIDLHEIAWRVGKLVINECPMQNCEGRLVTDGETGIIRVSNEIIHTGRQRFTISHEIGHFCLEHHKREQFEAHYTNRKKHDWIETEANHFASELLMPCKLIKNIISEITPEIASLIQISEAYQTSILATALKFIELTQTPCILVCIDSTGRIKWHRKSRTYTIPFYRRRIDANSLASYVLQSGEDMNHAEEVPKEMWLGRYSTCTTLKESAYCVNQTEEVISLLAVE